MRLIQRGERHTVADCEELVDRFLEANPSVYRGFERQYPLTHPRAPSWRGYYRAGRTVVFVDQCTKPGTGYSWPGHRSDRTLIGVAAHELGHHVHLSRLDFREISNSLPRERLVSGYEPDLEERFAETFRLFLLNPDLRARARPARYAFLLSMGLVPIETRPWRVVLGDIPPRMLASLDAWGPIGALTSPQTSLPV